MATIIPEQTIKLDKTRNTIHKVVDATYTVFKNGHKTYFQIDTYGLSDRKYNEKISQSIQFDEEMAKYLVEKLTKIYHF